MQKFLSLMIAGLTASFMAQAKEPQVLPANNETLALSIYNGNLALVKDSRPARLENGVNEVIFDELEEIKAQRKKDGRSIKE